MIENVKLQRHNESDQVKAFHSKMLMCDVLQERDYQQKLRKRKNEMDKKVDDQWREQEQQQLDQYDENLRNKLMKEYEKKMENAKDIKDQHTNFKINIIKRMQEEQLEGELIKRQVKEELIKEQERELDRRRK